MGLETEIYDAINTLLAVAGVECTYTRGADSCTITLVPGKDPKPVDQGLTPSYFQGGLFVDFIGLSADIDFGDGAITPALNDTITYNRGTTSTTFKVVNAPGETHFRFIDEPHRQCIRIHTVETGNT